MILIERFAYTKYGTVGILHYRQFSAYTIELPWLHNRVGESCIPPAAYKAIRHESPRHGPSLWIKGVPGRSEILMHVANGPHELDGCIGVGNAYGWWPEYDEMAVWNSADTLAELLARVSDEVTIDIREWRPAYP